MQDEKETSILKHSFIPKHIKISEEEKQRVLKEFGMSILQLPSIKQTDPAIKEQNTQPGDIIKIIRQSETSLETIFYRVVING